VKHLLIILSLLLLSSPVIGQSEKPQTIIIPTGSLGEMSEARIKILEKTLESKLDDYFAIVPKELFEEAQEQAFQEMDSDECTEDQCILMIKEILQIENAFKMDLISEDGDTQISITWNDQDQKRVEEEYCEGCKTKELRNMIGGLVEKLVGVKEEVVDKPVVVETPKVVPKAVPEPIVLKTEEDKTKGLFVSVGKKIAKRKSNIPSVKKLLDTKKCPNCDLSYANLKGANLRGANLSEANLTKANLSGADLYGAELSGANLSEANLKEVNLKEVNLTGANLYNANLTGANLSKAILKWANLSGAILYNANLKGANLSKAILKWANLSGAKMEGVIED
jgi:hypothetical protein